MPIRLRHAFTVKAALALALVIAADLMFYRRPFGWMVGAFALLWLGAVAASAPAVRRRGAGVGLLALAAALALEQIEDPNVLGAMLFWTALTAAVVAPRAPAFSDAWGRLGRLLWHALISLWGPASDAWRLHHVHNRRSRWRLLAVLTMLATPVAGSLVFLWLFSTANPVIADALSHLRLELNPDLFGRAFFCSLVLVLVWGPLRPRSKRFRPAATRRPSQGLPGVSVASVGVSLAAFNLLFAVQNALDIGFLWSGARLPQGMTLAEYAHRGAYPLIATALLAAVFVLVTLRPGSATAANRPIRWLVGAWILQNTFLTASSILRTVDLIQTYALTPLRIAALAWMALVALGLASIGFRILRDKSAAWLINTNAAAAAVVLLLASLLDLNALAAAWNVVHAREVGGPGAALDLCYLEQMGPSALTSLAVLELRPLDPVVRARVAQARGEALRILAARQADPASWTWRGERRLRRVQALIQSAHLAVRPQYVPGTCSGALPPGPSPSPVAVHD